jgi:hypothetical protein
MRRLLRHAPTGTRGAKAALFATEGQQYAVGTRVTAQAHKAVGQDATLQIGVKLLLHVRRQAFGGGIGREGGQKGLQVLSDDLVEDRLTGLSRLVEGRDHLHPFRRPALGPLPNPQY